MAEKLLIEFDLPENFVINSVADINNFLIDYDARIKKIEISSERKLLFFRKVNFIKILETYEVSNGN